MHEDAAGFELEGRFDVIEGEGLAVGGADDVDGTAEGFGEGGPALAELAGCEDEDAISGRCQVGDGGFHRSCSGGGEEDDIVGGGDEVFELGEDAGVEGAELGGAVVDVGGGHGELGGGEEGGGAGGEEAGFADHVGIVWAEVRVREGLAGRSGLVRNTLRDPWTMQPGFRPEERLSRLSQADTRYQSGGKQLAFTILRPLCCSEEGEDISPAFFDRRPVHVVEVRKHGKIHLLSSPVAYCVRHQALS